MHYFQCSPSSLGSSVDIINSFIEDVKLDLPDDERREGEVLNLNMSAKEMRELIARNKKWDPRLESERKSEKIDWWKKYKIIQTL